MDNQPDTSGFGQPSQRMPCTSLFVALGFTILIVARAAAVQLATESPIHVGDTVVVVRTEVKPDGRDKKPSALKSGDKMYVTEVRGEWIGGFADAVGARDQVWLLRQQVKVHTLSADDDAPIDRPNRPDVPQAVAALKDLGVKLELNENGRVHSADATESKLTDEGLTHFRGLSQLAVLDISSRPITDKGLAALNGLSVLQELYLNDTKITDQGLASLKDLRNLEILALRKTSVTGTGLTNVEKMSHLIVLNLSQCPIGDEHLKHLHKLPLLEVLTLPGTKVTNAGLEHLKPISKLRVLNLIDCAISDAGLEPMKTMGNLRMVYVRGTKVTPEGIKLMGEDAPLLAIFD